VKQIVIVIRVFALLSLLFVPSVLLVSGLGYIFGNTMSGWFGIAGIAVFLGNLAYVMTGKRRVRLWAKLTSIAGVPARK
jgi:hypothetical protein